jgi:hypothetical protein
MEVNELKQKINKSKSNFDDLLERNKDLDLTYIKNKLEEYDDLVHIIQYCIPNNKWMMPMLMNGRCWKKLRFKKRCKQIWLHTKG